MSTQIETTESDSQVWADLDAVLEHISSGTPLEAEVVRRVMERSKQSQDELRRRYGELNVVVDLVREIRDEE